MQLVFNFQLMRQLLINENNLQQTNDITIIKGCQRQQSAAQRALFEKYSGILFATCYRYVGNQTDARDTLQESFIRIFKYFNKFDPQKGSLKSPDFQDFAKLVIKAFYRHIQKTARKKPLL